MRPLVLVCVCLGLAGGVSRSASAQGTSQYGSLLLNKQVRDELRLSPRQQERAREVLKKVGTAMNEGMARLKDLNPSERKDRLERLMQELNDLAVKEFAGLLNGQQERRLVQVALQMRGLPTLSDPEIQKRLQMTAVQTQTIKTSVDKLAQELDAAREKAGKDEVKLKEWQALRQKKHKELLDGLVETLTPEQKTLWSEMVGKPFELK